MKLSVIIVSWNTRALTLQAIASIKRETMAFPCEIIVVDNASKDGSAQAIRAAHPDVRVIECARNTGFARANNAGLAIASGQYLLLLNSDTVVADRAIERMVAYMDAHAEVGMAGPKLVWPDGRYQPNSFRRLPNIKNAFAYLTGCASDYKPNIAPHAPAPAEAISGAAMLFRRSIYETIGGLDERFFMYGEDLDFCKRARDAGFIVYYLPQAVIVHRGGESSKQRKIGAIKNFYNAMWLYYQIHEAKNHNVIVNALGYLGIKLLLGFQILKNL
jgi:GT2 family glycosyltransferase